METMAPAGASAAARAARAVPEVLEAPEALEVPPADPAATKRPLETLPTECCGEEIVKQGHVRCLRDAS